MNLSYGNLIRRGLKENNMSQQDLADFLGVSQKTVSRYINNTVRVPDSNKERINSRLHINEQDTVDLDTLSKDITKLLLPLDDSVRLLVVSKVLNELSRY